MRPAIKAGLVTASAIVLILPALASAQQQMVVANRARSTVDARAYLNYVPPKTAFGAPDIQGVWTNASLTTLARPAQYGDRLVMTNEEAIKVEGTNDTFLASRNTNTDPKATVSDLPVDCGRGFTGVSCGYDNAWTDPGETVMRVNGQPRTSFLTTPDGRAPPRKAGAAPAVGRGAAPAAAPGAPGRAAAPRPAQNDNPEGRSLGERCLLSFGSSAGPVMLPLLYNNNYRIVQSRDSVAILVEMVHDVRTVRLNSKHRTDGVRPYFGDSIGWYEGNTLVVETTNFPRNQGFQGAWENLKVTERFTRVAANRLLYQFTVEDPTVWDKPFGGEYEFGASNGDVYEYACHEGNYALEGILAGARNDEAIAAGRASSGGTGAPVGRSAR